MKPSVVATLLASALAVPATGAGQSLQYRSPAGVEYRSQEDTGPIARAERAWAADPRNVERIIQLGIAQSGARQYREAIQTFTGGFALAPAAEHAPLFRWRGHRYLSVRELDWALDDLTRGSRLDSTNYGIWYHLGIVRYVRGDFAGAVDAFVRAQPIAPDLGERAAATDWLWMSLSRAGRGAEAEAMLARRPDSIPGGNAYDRRLLLYRGALDPDSVLTPADTGDIAVATLAYGVGNWYLVRGDTARARAWFSRSIASGGWPAFGFIAAEAELRRLAAAPAGGWTRVWSDEFDGAAGARIDTTRWRYDTADGCAAGICGWGNGEKQYYTTAPANVALNGQGQLEIVARRAPAGLTCYYGPCRYTSAKITTRGKMDAAPGRVAARIKLPAGQGLWPAFWMLGASFPATPWPDCGELDIMEYRGSNPAATSSAVHGPGYSGNTPFVHAHALERGTFADDFHTFAVEWDSLRVRFFVDESVHYTVTRGELERFGRPVLGQSFFVILNLAVGGTFDGDPRSDAVLPATLLVDYVRVYRPASGGR